MDAARRIALARLSLDGLSVGDALGCALLDPALLAKTEPAAPWRWTDDTAMAIEIVGGLERDGRIDPDALAHAFGLRFAADPQRGYGAVAYFVLTRIAEGAPWREVSSSVFHGTGSLGNGGAMRAAPIGAFFADDPSRAAAEAEASALPTHMHADGRAGAVAVAVAAAAIAGGARGDDVLAAARDATAPGRTRDGIARAIGLDATPAQAGERLGTGVEICAHDTVPYALWCAARHAGDFEASLRTCFAGLASPDADRDTLGAIVGGIAAVAPGATIPASWLAAREPLGVAVRPA